MALAPYREQGEGLALPVDEAFGATADGSVDELWRRVLEHPLVRASDRRSPYPPPPGGAPLLATRDGDSITVRYWRPRLTPERLRLELVATPAQAEGRTRVEGLIRSSARGIPRWRHRDETIEDVATLVAYGVAALVVGGLVVMLLGGGLMVFLAAPLVIIAQILGSMAFNRLADAVAGKPSRSSIEAPARPVQAHGGVTTAMQRWRESTRVPHPESAFERLLVDVGLVDPTS